MENDKLVKCKHCGGNACYEQHLNESTVTWFCTGCGFTSSTLMNEKGPVVGALRNSSPELYKDLMTTDKDGRVWVPATVTLPNKGMVFLDGTSKKDWKWSAVKAIEITDEERLTKKFPAEQTVKMDMKNMKQFGQRDFVDSLDYIDFFKED